MSHNAADEKRLNTFVGVLLGTAVGDSLGLPAEGMSRQRIRARWGGVWRHRFLFGHGMVSDDTEHALIVAREQNPERRDFYELCWHVGGSQSDIHPSFIWKQSGLCRPKPDRMVVEWREASKSAADKTRKGRPDRAT